MKKTLKFSILALTAICLLSSCSEKETKPEKIKYVKGSLKEITFQYPKNYEEDFRNESQVSYLLNSNEDLLFFLRWDEGVDTDMEERGKPKKVNDIEGYYWKDDDGSHTFAFEVNVKEGKVDYFISGHNEKVFQNVIESIKIKE